MSVQVGVRVRPFNTREKKLSSKCIISMPGENQTRIVDEKGKEKIYTFDHSFWSHDGYKTLDDGYLSPVDEKYADQKYIFNTVGKQVLDNAWQGYHCCLFAYGQTGSGKSYSMVGYGANKGIVPISCDEIFKRIGENKEKDKTFEVQVSMLEIYNEKVQDLLIPPNKRPSRGLKIRESRVMGIFVEGLTKYPVTSYQEISNKMDEGYNNRTIGSTLMNATSSRAHTIITIEFRQITVFAKKKSEKLSMINLVDLAGSERTGLTGATGDRLKEGCNINKSLLILGNVINCLADKAIGKNKNMLPPYRDSALTRILQNALGGNSKTIMICALSPASINYEETLSTLRYADRAKKIQNKAVVNESEHDKMVRLLKEENGNLKKMLEDLQKKLMGSNGELGSEDQEAFNELKEQYEANQLAMSDMQKTFEEKLEEAKKHEKEHIGQNIDISKPHLVVLDEDAQLSHKLKYSLENLPVYVGRKHGNPTPQITLLGIGVKQNHAIFDKKGNDIILKPNDKGAEEYIFVNGKKISEKGQIIHNKDRIVFGTNTIFLYMKSSNGEDIYSIDWETCQVEIQSEIEAASKRQIEENERRKKEELILLKKEFEEEYNQKKIEMQEQLKKQVEKYQSQLKELSENAEKQKIEQERIIQEQKLKEKLEQLEEEKAKKKREFEIRERNEMKKAQTQNNTNIIVKEKLEKNLMNILKKITKIKYMITEFNRNINMEVILQKNYMEKGEINSSPSIIIRVENYEEGTVYYWNPETFHNRFDLIGELFDKYMDEDFDINSITKEDDPLWDEPDESLLGYAFYKLEPVGYLMSNKSELSIINPHNGKLMGLIEIDIIPHDENNNEFDEVPEDPHELIGQSLFFKVVIYNIKNLPHNFCKNLRIEYQSFDDKSINYTKIYNQNENKQCEFSIGEEFEHKIDYITKEDIEYLEKENIKFKIYAYEDVEKKGKIKREENKIEEKKKEEKKVVNIQKSSTNKNLKTYANKNNEPDEPTEEIKKDGEIKINNSYANKNKIKPRGRSGSQKFRKINNLNKDKDKDCLIY